jgi:hypothetical protein
MQRLKNFWRRVGILCLEWVGRVCSLGKILDHLGNTRDQIGSRYFWFHGRVAWSNTSLITRLPANSVKVSFARGASHTGRQALPGTVNVALTGRSDAISAVDVGAFPEASVNTVKGTLNWNMTILCVDVAIGATKLGEAQASAVVAPSVASTVTRAGFQGAVQSTETRLAPAGAVDARPIVRAVPDTLWNRAVISTPVWNACAGAVVTVTVAGAVIRTRFDGAIKSRPAIEALAGEVLALSTRKAIVGAGADGAI